MKPQTELQIEWSKKMKEKRKKLINYKKMKLKTKKQIDKLVEKAFEDFDKDFTTYNENKIILNIYKYERIETDKDGNTKVNIYIDVDDLRQTLERHIANLETWTNPNHQGQIIGKTYKIK